MVKLLILMLMSLIPLITFMTRLVAFGVFWVFLILLYMGTLGVFTYLQTGDKTRSLKIQAVPIGLLLVFFLSFGFQGIGGETMGETLSHLFMVVFIIIYFSPVLLFGWLLSQEIKKD